MSDSDQEDGLLNKLMKAFGRKSKETEESNPILVFIQALMSFFKDLLKPDANAPAVDEGPLPGSQNSQGDFNRSVTDYFKPGGFLKPGNVLKVPRELAALKKQSEGALGSFPHDGKHILAISPVEGDAVVSSGFGHRERPVAGATTEHQGVDIAPVTEDTAHPPRIKAPMPGVVVGAGWKRGYGNTVDILDIYGNHQLLAHLESIAVKTGQQVSQGEVIGVMGGVPGRDGISTGMHLHYEQRSAGNITQKPVILGKALEKGGQLLQSQSLLALDAQKSMQTIDLSALHNPSADYVPPVPSTLPARARNAGLGS